MNKRNLYFFLLCSLLVSVPLLLHFHEIVSGSVLIAGDRSFVNAIRWSPVFAGRFFDQTWDNTWLLGNMVVPILPNIDFILAHLVSPFANFQINVFLPILLLFFTFTALFRTLKFRWSVSVSVALLAAFSPVHLTFLNPGHLAKLYTIALLPAAFAFVHRGMTRDDGPVRTLVEFGLSGFFLGWALLQGETPVGIYAVMVLVSYAIFLSLSRKADDVGRRWLPHLLSEKVRIVGLAVLAVASLAIAYPLVVQQMGEAIQNRTGETAPVDPQPKESASGNTWEWATQWSFPPEELLEQVAPGLFGNQSGDPEGPYWGRTGRSAEWSPEAPRGWSNFSQTSPYLGFTLLFFAVFAAVFARSRFTWFWIGVGVVALLFSFGRFFPAYALLFHLPVFDKFRNPNRWIHVAYLAAAVLAAYGLSGFLEYLKSEVEERRRRVAKVLLRSFGILLGALVLAFAVTGIGQEGLQESLAPVVGEGALAAANQVMTSIGKGILLALLLFLPLALILRAGAKKAAPLVVALVLVIGLGDAWLVNRKFLRFMDPDQLLRKDAVVDEIVSLTKTHRERVKYVTRGPYLKNLLDNSLPYAGVDSIDIPAMRSFPPELATFWGRVNPNQPRHYEILSTRWFLSEQPVAFFGMQPIRIWGNPAQGRGVLLYDLPTAAPRVRLVRTVSVRTNLDQLFGRLNAPDYDPRRESALLKDRPWIERITPGSNAGSVESLLVESSRLRFRTRSDAPALLVVGDRYHPSWKVTVDGVEAESVRADYLLRGVFVEAGDHVVEWTLRRTFLLNGLPWVFWILFLSTFALWGVDRIRSRRLPADPKETP